MFNPLYINPGELRNQIAIQTKSQNDRDGYGQLVETWVTILTTRAKIESTTGASYKDTFAQNARVNQSTKLITIRYPGSNVVIQAGQRIVHGNDIYTVQDVDNVLERNRKLRIAAMQIQDTSV
jgi:SPP1 family predicted phage head-tail adaptor